MMARPLPVAASATRVRLGDRLLAARRSAGMTIEEVATRAGLTRGFVSRIERDRTSPSVTTLVTLCEVLRIRVDELFEPAEAAVVRAESAPVIQLGGVDVVERLVSPRGEGGFQVIRSVVLPGGNGGPEKYAVDAEREFVVVLRGEVRILFSDVSHHLVEGDSLTFDGREPHGWCSATGADLLWVLRPAPWANGA